MGVRTYVVEDDHAILYAGQDVEVAIKFLRGPNTMSVWQNNEWLGNMRHNFEWSFITAWGKDNNCAGELPRLHRT